MTAYIATGITVDFSTLNADLLDVNHGGESADIVDVTHQKSAADLSDGWREKLAGLKDAGEVTLPCLFDPDATVPALATSATLTVTWPSATTNKFSCSAILSCTGVAASLGHKMVQDLTLTLTGLPNWAAS